jgi:hypothetical protein
MQDKFHFLWKQLVYSKATESGHKERREGGILLTQLQPPLAGIKKSKCLPPVTVITGDASSSISDVDITKLCIQYTSDIRRWEI